MPALSFYGVPVDSMLTDLHVLVILRQHGAASKCFEYKTFRAHKIDKKPLIVLTRKLKDPLDRMRPQDRIFRIKIPRSMDMMNEYRVLVEEEQRPGVRANSKSMRAEIFGSEPSGGFIKSIFWLSKSACIRTKGGWR